MSIKQTFYKEGDTLVRKRTQPIGHILEETKRRRNHKTARDLEGLGRPALTIPDLEYRKLIRANPDLDPAKADAETRNKAWRKFCRSAASRPWRNFDVI